MDRLPNLPVISGPTKRSISHTNGKREKLVAVQVGKDKSLGQNFLKNPGVLDKIINAAQIKSCDHVLEIGPGSGNLTVRAMALCQSMTIVEIDPRMVIELKKRCQSHPRGRLVKIIQGDAMKVEFPRFDVCIANLPYQISSPFVFRLCHYGSRFKCAILMFQLEFAERLVATVGSKNYGRLAINAQFFYKVTRVTKVDRNSFNPPPKVDSMVLKFIPRHNKLPVDPGEFDGLLRVGFGRKHKMLMSSFKQQHAIEEIKQASLAVDPSFNINIAEAAEKIFNDLGHESARAIGLSGDQYLEILLEFNKLGIRFPRVGRLADLTSEECA